MNCGYRVCKHNCSSHNGSRAHAANKRVWRWSREKCAKETFFLAKMAFSGNRNIDQLPWSKRWGIRKRLKRRFLLIGKHGGVSFSEGPLFVVLRGSQDNTTVWGRPLKKRHTKKGLEMLRSFWQAPWVSISASSSPRSARG